MARFRREQVEGTPETRAGETTLVQEIAVADRYTLPHRTGVVGRRRSECRVALVQNICNHLTAAGSKVLYVV